MSKGSGKGHHRRKVSRPPQRPTSDAAVYAGLLLITLFGLFIAYVIWPVQFREIVVGVVIGMLALINLYAVQAYRGTRLQRWQQALARLVLRFAGFRSTGGRPLDAAAGDSRVRAALLASVVVSALIAAALIVVVVRSA